MLNEIIKQKTTEEEHVFQQFCDCVDADLRWRGLPPIAETDEERRQKVVLYMLRSIEAYKWFASLVGGLDVLERLLGKRASVSPHLAKRDPDAKTKRPVILRKIDR